MKNEDLSDRKKSKDHLEKMSKRFKGSLDQLKNNLIEFGVSQNQKEGEGDMTH